jgi:hypothetical protein
MRCARHHVTVDYAATLTVGHEDLCTMDNRSTNSANGNRGQPALTTSVLTVSAVCLNEIFS